MTEDDETPSPLAGEGWGEGYRPENSALKKKYNFHQEKHQRNPSIFKRRSRNLRKEQTEAEKKIWSRIRGKQLGYKFRRQFGINARYIVDFVCLEKKLIIEIDGSQHYENQNDQERDNYLKNLGFLVIRFWNNEVLEDVENCLEKIRIELL